MFSVKSQPGQCYRTGEELALTQFLLKCPRFHQPYVVAGLDDWVEGQGLFPFSIPNVPQGVHFIPRVRVFCQALNGFLHTRVRVEVETSL